MANPKVLERFRREAQAIARLSHPSIVSIFDFDDASDPPYLVMEHVDGSSLRHLLQEQGALSPRAVVWTALKLVAALQSAHEKDVVHRDIKPENVLISKKREVKLADFGVVRFVNSSDSSLSMEGELFGTPQYMAPEQLRGQRDVDQRVDYYALGILLFEMLAGHVPFESKDLMELYKQHCESPLPDLRELCPKTPNELVRLIEELCQKDREDRLCDAVVITSRLHELVAQWTSLPAMFPGVTRRHEREVLVGGGKAAELAERALTGPLEKTCTEILQERPAELPEFCHRVAEGLLSDGRMRDILTIHPILLLGAPELERVHIIAAIAYRHEKRYSEALTSMRCAWLLDPGNPRAALEVARAHLSLKDRNSAIGIMTELEQRHAEDSAVLERVGEFYQLELSDPKQALRVFHLALAQRTERWPLLQKIGWLALETGDPKSAIEVLQEASESSPEPALALRLLARARSEVGENLDAESTLKRSLELDPKDAETRTELIELYKSRGDNLRVAELARGGLEQKPDDRLMALAFADACLELGSIKRAGKIYRSVLEAHPRDDRAKKGLIAVQRARPKRENES